MKSELAGMATINYTHTFSFTFSTDFPLAAVWPERLDPPARSGGGELTNLGCYAVDYMIGLWGRPRLIEAKSTFLLGCLSRGQGSRTSAR